MASWRRSACVVACPILGRAPRSRPAAATEAGVGGRATTGGVASLAKGSIVAAIGVVLALSGCATLASLRGRAVPACPGPLVSTADIEGDFLSRERVRYFVGDESTAFQQVVQKRGSELLLLGLHPLGAKLFSVVQRGLDVEIDAVPPPLLEVPPETLLADLHRVRFHRVADAGPEGTFRSVGAGSEIVEKWSKGRLRQRSFPRVGGGRGVWIEFPHADEGDGRGPVVVENPDCGYRAEIESLDVD